jgi:hypothetical protein
MLLLPTQYAVLHPTIARDGFGWCMSDHQRQKIISVLSIDSRRWM